MIERTNERTNSTKKTVPPLPRSPGCLRRRAGRPAPPPRPRLPLPGRLLVYRARGAGRRRGIPPDAQVGSFFIFIVFVFVLERCRHGPRGVVRCRPIEAKRNFFVLYSMIVGRIICRAVSTWLPGRSVFPVLYIVAQIDARGKHTRALYIKEKKNRRYADTFVITLPPIS